MSQILQRGSLSGLAIESLVVYPLIFNQIVKMPNVTHPTLLCIVYMQNGKPHLDATRIYKDIDIQRIFHVNANKHITFASLTFDFYRSPAVLVGKEKEDESGYSYAFYHQSTPETTPNFLRVLEAEAIATGITSRHHNT